MNTQTEAKSQTPAAIEVYLRDLNRVRAANGDGDATVAAFASVGDGGDYVALLRYGSTNFRDRPAPWWGSVAVTRAGVGWPAIYGLGSTYGGSSRRAEVERFDEIVANVVDIRDLL